ncbi:MAG: hypothetical protein IJY20_02150 [Clostridia bacterium]|nr:hypothetical protein [Clostridia bacterium]
MKKLIFGLVMAATLATALTGCGKFTCDLCNEEKSGKQYKDEMFGQEVVICKDCYNDLKELEEGLEDLSDKFK